MPSLSSEDVAILAGSVESYVETATSGAAGRWREISELGWLGLTVGVADGGLDGGAAGLAEVMRGAGRGLIAEPILSTGVLCATLIEKAGSAEQRARLLPEIIDGTLRLALADRETQAGHDRDWRHMRADAAPQGYRLTGAKQYVADYAGAGKLIVTARLADGELALFLLDQESTGIAATLYPALDDRPMANLHFEHVAVPHAARLPGDTAAALAAAYDLATIGICAEAAGIVAALNAMTLEHLKTRKQFGVSLGSFQVLQHRMVDMTVSAMEMTALLERAVTLHDAGHADATRWISAAKAMAGVAGRMIAESALQMHGGMGMTDDLRVGHYLKRLIVIGGSFGDADWHIEQIAGRGIQT